MDFCFLFYCMACFVLLANYCAVIVAFFLYDRYTSIVLFRHWRLSLLIFFFWCLWNWQTMNYGVFSTNLYNQTFLWPDLREFTWIWWGSYSNHTCANVRHSICTQSLLTLNHYRPNARKSGDYKRVNFEQVTALQQS